MLGLSVYQPITNPCYTWVANILPLNLSPMATNPSILPVANQSDLSFIEPVRDHTKRPERLTRIKVLQDVEQPNCHSSKTICKCAEETWYLSVFHKMFEN